ncbi:MAG TPA: hypothetical protein V6D08_06090 [Candidatus Obscuribacterales bacterium]
MSRIVLPSDAQRDYKRVLPIIAIMKLLEKSAYTLDFNNIYKTHAPHMDRAVGEQEPHQERQG